MTKPYNLENKSDFSEHVSAQLSQLSYRTLALPFFVLIAIFAYFYTSGHSDFIKTYPEIQRNIFFSLNSYLSQFPNLQYTSHNWAMC